MKQTKTAGFTLIEILVVLFIVAVMSTVTVIAVRGLDAQSIIDNTVRKLAYSLEVAEEETLFRRRTLGLLIDAKGYSFLSQTEKGWSSVSDRFYQSQRFPDELVVSFYVDGDPQVLDVEPVTDEKITPQIIFTPDAEPIPFEILFELQGLKQRKIERTPSGRIVTDLREKEKA